MDIKNLLGARIQEIRKAAKLTQEQMAEAIGIETVSMSNIERGKYYPTAENLNKICEVLKVTPEELFKFTHLAPHKQLLHEMYERLQYDESLTRLVYKFFKMVKN